MTTTPDDRPRTLDEALDVLDGYFVWVDNVGGPGGAIVLDADDPLCLHPQDCERIAAALLIVARANAPR